MKRWHLIAGGVTLAFLVVFYMTGSHWFRDTYVVEITGREKDPQTNVKMVYGTLLNGDGVAFTYEDSTLEGVWNSRDRFASLAIGKKYRITAYGFRVHWPWTSYENIAKVELYQEPLTADEIRQEIKVLEEKLEKLRSQLKETK